jgi:hypothetical protein
LEVTPGYETAGPRRLRRDVAPRQNSATLRRRPEPNVTTSAAPTSVPLTRLLGHDIKTLLRAYGHVIRGDEDRVRAMVDETLGQTAEDWLRTEGVL